MYDQHQNDMATLFTDSVGNSMCEEARKYTRVFDNQSIFWTVYDFDPIDKSLFLTTLDPMQTNEISSSLANFKVELIIGKNLDVIDSVNSDVEFIASCSLPIAVTIGPNDEGDINLALGDTYSFDWTFSYPIYCMTYLSNIIPDLSLDVDDLVTESV